MKNLAVIPARSGSKGVKDKNIRLLNGKPLLAYTIEVAQKSAMFEEIFLSTDSEAYAEIGRRFGANIPFLRTSELATDTASSIDVVREAIYKYREIGKEFDTVALLQPTSPLRTPEDIMRGYEIMKEKGANAVIGVCEVEHSPLWMNTLPDDMSMHNFIKEEFLNKPRQQLPRYYRINGALYIFKTEYILSTDNIYKDKCFACIMPRENSVDIDSEMDFLMAEWLLILKRQGKDKKDKGTFRLSCDGIFVNL